MSSKQLSQKETHIPTQDGLGRQFEQTLIVNDNPFPSPEELAKYKAVSEELLDTIIKAIMDEQAHRHAVDLETMRSVSEYDKRGHILRKSSLRYALLAFLSIAVLTGLGMFLDKEWMTAVFGCTTVVSVVSLLLKAGKSN